MSITIQILTPPPCEGYTKYNKTYFLYRKEHL